MISHQRGSSLTFGLMMTPDNGCHDIDWWSCHLLLFVEVFRDTLAHASDLNQIVLTVYFVRIS